LRLSPPARQASAPATWIVGLALLAGVALGQQPAAPLPRIEPAGIGGALLVCGAGTVAPQAVEQFLDLAGGQYARIVILAPAAPADEHRKVVQTLIRLGKERNAAIKERHLLGPDLSDDALRDLSQATGVWFIAADETSARKFLVHTPLANACTALLRRRGALGVSAPASAVLGRICAAGQAGSELLADSVVMLGAGNDKNLLAALKKNPGLVGCRLGDGAALLLKGRTLHAVGHGRVFLQLAASPVRPARTIVLEGQAQEDFTALRRAARDRAASYPPKQPSAPVVEKGSLFIVGGGSMPKTMMQKFVDLAGGAKSSIVLLPTAAADPIPPKQGAAEALRKAGAGKVTVLWGRTRTDVENPASLQALKEATGIWFGGGRQWRFVDAYEGTKALPLMWDVLKRGGAIGGTSAGATILGDYLCRGGVFDNFAIEYEGYERGLGFLPGVAIDQHFTQRKRARDMSALMKTFPQYLGIGIDESTALLVRGQIAEVLGLGKAFFFDAQAQRVVTEPLALSAGGRYDLKARTILQD